MRGPECLSASTAADVIPLQGRSVVDCTVLSHRDSVSSSAAGTEELRETYNVLKMPGSSDEGWPGFARVTLPL